jgi:hypothetical protein
MKNYIKSIALSAFCLTSVALTGCEDFLNEDPQSQYSADTFYKQDSDFEFAIAGVYAQQQGMFAYSGGAIRLPITRADELVVGAGYCDENDTFTDNGSGSVIPGYWNSLYTMVYRTNAILDKIDDVEFKDATKKSNIKGEALALRAWAYYNLGINFGGVPLINKTLSTPETKQIARSTQAETFAFAANDFKAAIDLLPAEWTGNGLGRVTKYAAMAGFARLYMFEGNFSSAAPLLKSIIDSGKYKMAENYVDCFNDAFDNTEERVWEVQFMSGGLGEGNNFAASFFPEGYNKAEYNIPGSSAFMDVSTDFVNAYEEGDLRKDVTLIADITVGSSVREGWYVHKWLHNTAVPVNHDDYAINWPIVRYTDVIMMYAECLNEAGYVADGEAFKLINSVRERAGLAPLTAATTPDQAAFRKAIMQERRVEFAFEGLRWWDLVRWDTALEVMNAFLKQAENENGKYQMGSNDRKIYAIPNTEIDRYGDTSVMWQNPGY